MTVGNDEHKLIQDFVKGDALSFDQIFSKYNKKVYTFSFRNLKNREDAEGIVQEVFFNLWKDREKLKEIKNLDAWIFTICFNTIRKHFRQLTREKKHLQKFAEFSSEEDNATITAIEYNDLLEKAEEIIEQLPLRQKTIFLLSKKDGLSNDEISVKLNITKKNGRKPAYPSKIFHQKSACR
ncbi:MAG: RNA polymerase sigma factor [Mangrovibacterium sp.]